MTKENINLMLINGLKAKGHNIGNISLELLNDVAVIFQKQLELTAVVQAKPEVCNHLFDVYETSRGTIEVCALCGYKN
jgi:hypothetical protein